LLINGYDLYAINMKRHKINIYNKLKNMKAQKRFLTVIILTALILFQGCVATIVSTSKQTVKINSKPSEAAVYLDDQKMERTPTKLRVKRSTGGEVKIEKDGYKTHIEMLYKDKTNPVTFISMLFLLYPYYVDLMTGAAFKLNKNEIDIELIEIPRKIDGSQTIFCDAINFKIKAGDKLGNFYIRDSREDILYFGVSLDVDAVNLKLDANNILKDLGFTIAETKGQLFSPSAQARYFIRAEVLNTKYDIKASHVYEIYAKFSTECEMSIKWQLVDRSDKVEFEATTTGKSIKYEKGGTSAFYDAFENAFYHFLYNEKIYKITEKTSDLFNETPDYQLIKIVKPAIPKDNDKIINNATNSFVTIENSKSHGSGCVISEDGYIVTNYHVTGGSDKVMVKFKNGFSLEGNVVRYSQEYDLALIKVNGSGFSPILISEDREINIGSEIYAIGTPADKSLGQTVTKGIISGKRNMLDKEFIQTDVSINPGSSGGGLVNKYGYLVGIVNAKLVGESVEGIGFAIPGYTIFEKLKIGY
jgi:serine protease Do